MKIEPGEKMSLAYYPSKSCSLTHSFVRSFGLPLTSTDVRRRMDSFWGYKLLSRPPASSLSLHGDLGTMRH